MSRDQIFPPHQRLNAIVSAAIHAASAMRASRAATTARTIQNEIPPMQADTPTPIDQPVLDAALRVSIAPWCASLVRHQVASPANDLRTEGDEMSAAAEVGGDDEPDDGEIDPSSVEGRDRRLLALLVGRRIRAAREAAGIRQLALSRGLAYCSPAQLSQWESGKRMPPVQALLALAAALGCTTDYLLGVTSSHGDLADDRRARTISAVKAVVEAAAERVADALDAADTFGAKVGTAAVRDLVFVAKAAVRRLPANDPDGLFEAATRVEQALRRLDEEDAVAADRLARVVRAS
jgi:transcriptional regulator with XRE-family HTH domain